MSDFNITRRNTRTRLDSCLNYSRERGQFRDKSFFPPIPVDSWIPFHSRSSSARLFFIASSAVGRWLSFAVPTPRHAVLNATWHLSRKSAHVLRRSADAVVSWDIATAGFQRTLLHCIISRSKYILRPSSVHRYACVSKRRSCADTASKLTAAAPPNPFATLNKSARMTLRRASSASALCVASCWSTSSCCFRLERLSTDIATKAARTAAGIAPSAPAHIEIHTSLSNPQSMGLSLREVC